MAELPMGMGILPTFFFAAEDILGVCTGQEATIHPLCQPFFLSGYTGAGAFSTTIQIRRQKSTIKNSRFWIHVQQYSRDSQSFIL